MTWGIVPAAGIGSRIQPLAFSKELLPVGSRLDDGVERPRAVSEYLVDRMIRGGATKIVFVISPGKSDIVEYYGGRLGTAHVSYVVQSEPNGLCDAIFQALPLIGPDEAAIVGLPDTVWFPDDALCALPDGKLSFLCFPVDEPQHFDAVVSERDGTVREIQVKSAEATSQWIWGAFKLPRRVLSELHAIWSEPGRGDPYVGTLVNEWVRRGGSATAVHAGTGYVDVGTMHGYRDAMRLLDGRARTDAPRPHALKHGAERS
jgi:glucose-1-phosphate thymidylyltransferase